MKKVLLLVAVFCVWLGGSGLAQVSLSIDKAFTVSHPDSVDEGDTLSYKVVVRSLGPGTLTAGTLSVQMSREDSSSYIILDTLSTFVQNFKPQDTASFQLSKEAKTPNFILGNVNVIVIWSYSNLSNVYAADSLFDSVYTVPANGIIPWKDLLNTVKVYPNPANCYLNVAVENPEKNIEYVRILDLDGCEVRRLTPVATGIDLRSLRSGCYFVEVLLTSGRSCSVKILKE